MTKIVVERFDRAQVTPRMAEDAARFFNAHYGTWDPDHVPVKSAEWCHFKPGLPGTQVKLNGHLLLTNFLTEEVPSCYVRASINGVTVGYALICRWAYGDRQVCWVTQLVVHRAYRDFRVATTILTRVRDDDDDIFGIASPHPAACKALARACGDYLLPHIPWTFARQNATDILACSPVKHLRAARPRGKFYRLDDPGVLVSAVDLGVHLDTVEIAEAVKRVKEEGEWPLGDLLGGYEFLLVFEVPEKKRLARDRRKAQDRRKYAQTVGGQEENGGGQGNGDGHENGN